MSKDVVVGKEGPNNAKLGGVPAVHYLDFQSKGRGQVLRLFFEDAGIAYRDVRYAGDDYGKFKQGKLAQWNPLAKVPIVELNGRILTQSYAILRHFSRQLGAYDGKTDEEKYFVDLVNDIGIDWRTQFVTAFLSSNKEDYQKYGAGPRGEFAKAVENHLQTNELSKDGPYVIGSEITYADLVIYQVLHDDGLTKEGRKGLQEYPRLKQLADAIEARPNVKAFLESDRYLG